MAIRLRRSDEPLKVPPALEVGEVAVNVADDPPRLFVGTAGGVVELFGDRLRELEHRIAALEAAARAVKP